MPEVYIPKDLTQVQNKVIFGLTRRQLVCFSLAAVVSVPIYLLTRKPLGGDTAMVLLIVSALPFFFTALYRKNRSAGGTMPEKLCPRSFPDTPKPSVSDQQPPCHTGTAGKNQRGGGAYCSL